MTFQLVYGAVTDPPRKVIHVVRVVDDLLDIEQLDEIADRMRHYAMRRYGEQAPNVVVVQGYAKETLRLFGEPYAVARVRAAMFNAAINFRPIDLG